MVKVSDDFRAGWDLANHVSIDSLRRSSYQPTWKVKPLVKLTLLDVLTHPWISAPIVAVSVNISNYVCF